MFLEGESSSANFVANLLDGVFDLLAVVAEETADLVRCLSGLVLDRLEELPDVGALDDRVRVVGCLLQGVDVVDHDGD